MIERHSLERLAHLSFVGEESRLDSRILDWITADEDEEHRLEDLNEEEEQGEGGDGIATERATGESDHDTCALRYGAGYLLVLAVLGGDFHNAREYHVLGKFALTVSSLQTSWKAAAYESGGELRVQVPFPEHSGQEERFMVSFETFTNSAGPCAQGAILAVDVETETQLAGPMPFSIYTYGEEPICDLTISPNGVELVPSMHCETRSDSHAQRISSRRRDPSEDVAVHYLALSACETSDLMQGSATTRCEERRTAKVKTHPRWNSEESVTHLLQSISDQTASSSFLEDKLARLTTKLKFSAKHGYTDIIVDDLSPFFGMTRERLSRRTGVCLTVLKKVIRKAGIVRWPCRKHRQWQRKAELLNCKYEARIRAARSRKHLSDCEARYNSQMEKLKHNYVADIGSLISS